MVNRDVRILLCDAIQLLELRERQHDRTIEDEFIIDPADVPEDAAAQITAEHAVYPLWEWDGEQGRP